jgi:hypothetical protein
MSDNSLENKKNIRMLLYRKYWFENFGTLILLISIFALAYFKLIDSITTGTLMGAILGYTLKTLENIKIKSKEVAQKCAATNMGLAKVGL